MCPDEAAARDERESLPPCCLATARLVQQTRMDLVCDCGEAYFFDRASALPRPPRPRRSVVPVVPGAGYVDFRGRRRSSVPGDPGHRATMPAPPPRPVSIAHAGEAIALLLAWLPDLSARSVALVRDNIRVETSAVAMDGRIDRIDEQSRRVNAAVRAWTRLREMVADGLGAHVAVLWAAHAGVVEMHDAQGRRLGGPAQRARVVEAVALGCASKALRGEWREVAAERPSVVGYMSRIEPAAVSPIPTAGTPSVRHELPAGMQDRERWVRHLEQRGAHGPSVDAQAVAWGAERMADLWAPGVVPAELARGFALGFAGAEERARWEALRVPAVRDAEVAARGERLLRAAEDAWGAR